MLAVDTGKQHRADLLPASLEQTPRPHLDGLFEGAASVNYNIEGSDVGYRWYDANNVLPLFPFGYGLSYTTFGYSNLTVGPLFGATEGKLRYDPTEPGPTA